MSVLSGVCSSRLKQKDSRCPGERAVREGATVKAQGKLSLGRRQFFRVLGAGTAVGAVGSLATEAVADSESNDEKRKPRYRESNEVKTFYRVNRYPS
jgi:hypothetical protein